MASAPAPAPASTPAEPASEAAIASAFARLDAALVDGSRKKAMKAVDDILKLSPADPDALAAHAFLLHEGERFAEALAAYEKVSSSGDDQPALSFAKAHALYGLGRVDDAAAALQRVTGAEGDVALAARHLKAQIAYRQGRYADAIVAYDALASAAASSSDPDALAANVAACYVSEGRGRDARAAVAALSKTTCPSHEVEFNLACAALDAGDLEDAAAGLARAEAAVKAAAAAEAGIEDGTPSAALPPGLAADAAVIRAQAVHVANLRGDASPAETAAAYHEMLSGPSLDGAARAVAANNAAAAATAAAGGAPAAHRRAAAVALHATDALVDRSAPARLAPALESRLPAIPHARALLANRALLLAAAGRPAPAAAAATEAATRWPGDARLALVRVGLAKAAGAAAATAALADAPVTDPAVAAAKAQLAAEAGDAKGALAALSAWASAAGLTGTEPAVVATTIDLLVSAGDAAGAEAAVDAALARLESGSGSSKASGWLGGRGGGGAEPAPPASARAWLLARKARLRLGASDLDGAVRAWTDLRGVAERAAAAGDEAGASAAASAAAALMTPLAAAGAAAGPGSAAAASAASRGLADLVAGLPPIAAPSGEALDRLEAAPPGAARTRRRARPAKGKAAPAAAPAPSRKRRKPRYPAGVDPAAPGPAPAPEAAAEKWLPKWARSDAAKAKKQRRAGGAAAKGGAQGAGKVDESLDAALRPTAVPAVTAPVGGGGGKKAGGGGGKKKGRR